MKNILKAILIFAIMFNCTIFANYSVYAVGTENALTYSASILLLRTPGVPPQALNTGYAKNADTNPL